MAAHADVEIRTSADRSRRWALASLSGATLLAALGTSIANVGLPALTEAFDAPLDRVQWVVLGYLVAMTAGAVAAGRLADRVGRRKLFFAGIALFTGAAAVGVMTPSLPVLVAARAAQGGGAAAMTALAMALAGEVAGPGRTGRAVGLLGTLSAVGTAVGPTLGGVLLAAFGWRALFMALVALGLGALVLAWRALPCTSRTRPTEIAPRPRTSALLLDPAPLAGLAALAAVSAVVMATMVVGPFHLARGLGLDPVSVGLALSAGPVVAAVTGAPAGLLVDRCGAARVAVAGLIAVTAGSALLASLPPALGLLGWLGPIVVLTAGYAVFQAANSTAVLTAAGPDRRGLAAGLLTLARNLGLMAGTALAGAAFSRGPGAVFEPDLVAGRTQAVFGIVSVAALIAAIVVVAAGVNTLRSKP